MAGADLGHHRDQSAAGKITHKESNVKKQEIFRSCHVYETFMPLQSNESMMVDTMEGLSSLNYYQAVETGFFFEPANIRRVRDYCRQNNWELTMWATPTLLAENLNLSTLDAELREKSVKRTIELLNYAMECGADKIGLPSGSDPGEGEREEAKKVFFDSMCRIANHLSSDPTKQVLVEPLDRHAHKKQLIGPIREAVEWFAPLHQECPNTFIHWDSAHEALGGIDLIESLRVAKPFLSQLHLCNAVTDPGHPMYGDWHMDMGQAPEFKSPGYMTPELGAAILKEIASWPVTDGCKATFVAVEMRSHMGDDMWNKEQTARRFLNRCLELAA